MFPILRRRYLPICYLLLSLQSSMALAGAHGSSGLSLSEAERKDLRDFMNTFVAEMDAKYFARVTDMNGGAVFEDRAEGNEYSDYELRVTRGEVMEKAGRMLSIGKKLSPGRGDGVLTWGRFYSLDMHPKSPLVGMLHATIVMQQFEDGSAAVGGWLGVMPGTKVDEDLALLKQVTDEYFAERDKNPALYRKLICKGTHETIAEFRRKPACSGVSFYGPPVYRGDAEASLQFIAGLFDEFVATYMDIVEKRAAEPFTEADVVAQDNMRRQWLIDQLYSDPFASKLVPFSAWSFANMPPIVKF
jgi:coproporphyrinogen III oxidase